jgi:glutamyl endopeptidase
MSQSIFPSSKPRHLLGMIVAVLTLGLSAPALAGLNDPVKSDGTATKSSEAGNAASIKGNKGSVASFAGNLDGESEGGVAANALLAQGVAEVFNDGVVPDWILEQEKDLVPASPYGIDAAREAMIESVIGVDSRQQLKTTGFPARATVYITLNGSHHCSGFLIGSNTVATAGHCVNRGNGGGFYPVNQFRVYPGRDGASAPYGYCTAKWLATVTGWSVSGSDQYDYGAIKLNCTVGNTVGSYGFFWTTANLINQPTIVQGYPGDKTSGTQWVGADINRCNATRKLFYKDDTYGGNSGGPIWNDTTFSTSGIYAMGIHAYGYGGTGCYATNNSGTRITQPVYNNLVAWKNAP